MSRTAPYAGLTVAEMKAVIVAINSLTHGQWRDTLNPREHKDLLSVEQKLCKAMIAKTAKLAGAENVLSVEASSD